MSSLSSIRIKSSFLPCFFVVVLAIVAVFAFAVVTFAVGRFITLIPGGALLDSIGARLAVIGTPVVITAATLSVAVLPSYGLLMAAMLLVGGAAAGANFYFRREKVPTVTVEVESDIPMAAGLGSSAAASVAGLRVFERVAGPLSDDVLLAAATAVEGHADNAAPALFGGLTSVLEVEGHAPTALRWAWPEELRLVVATPAVGLATAKARAALPEALPRTDAVFNLQRVLALVHALERRDYARLGMAREEANAMPLGSGAIAGTSYAVDVHALAAALGRPVAQQESDASASAEDGQLLVARPARGAGLQAREELLLAHRAHPAGDALAA